MIKGSKSLIFYCKEKILFEDDICNCGCSSVQDRTGPA